jgi:quercetin 2,3-dioxygenase
MITIRKAEDRGHASQGWLDTWHTFSFADYYDPEHMGFRSLRVINDDIVAGGGGFPTHPHRDMEIITYIVSGALQHRDSMGHSAVMRAGDVQRISAGTGIQHSEFNHSPTESVRLLQIWITPNQKNVTPSYAEKSFADAPVGQFILIASQTDHDNSIPINQDANVFLVKLNAGDAVTHKLARHRYAWLQVAVGEIEINGQVLKSGDAAAINEEEMLNLSGIRAAQVLVFDLA